MPGTPPTLVASVTADRIADLQRARDEAARDGDIVELRLDGVGDLDVRGALAGRAGPVVATCRPAWEGGRFVGSEEDRERLLIEALDAGANWIDIEWNAPGRGRLLAAAGRRAVLSLHDFDGVPADLAARVDAMARATPGVVKVAVRARRLSDLLPLLHLGRQFGGSRRLVLIGMGEAGVVSRLLAARFGSCWSYAGEGVAPGQIPPRRMLDEFRFRAIAPDTAVFGLLGRPTGHSLSPAMHNAAFGVAAVDAVYVPLEAEDFGDFSALAEALDIAGVSVTAPYKRAAFDAALTMPEHARRVGAVNTLRRRGPASWEANNTDVPGFLAPLTDEPLEGRRATILGAGGAARAVAVALASRGARVTVCGRRIEAARAVAAAAGAATVPWPPPPASWDLLVNSTPVGTWPFTGDSPMQGLPLDGDLVYDLVYNPETTRLLGEARAHGCRALGGLAMLVSQAAEQWTWWTGKDAPVAVMRDAARRRLAAMTTEHRGR